MVRMASNVDQMGSAGWLQGELVNSYRRGGRRQVVKAAACGAAIRGFESPRSPSTFPWLHKSQSLHNEQAPTATPRSSSKPAKRCDRRPSLLKEGQLIINASQIKLNTSGKKHLPAMLKTLQRLSNSSK